jgi:hypothetical protein
MHSLTKGKVQSLPSTLLLSIAPGTCMTDLAITPAIEPTMMYPDEVKHIFPIVFGLGEYEERFQNHHAFHIATLGKSN